MKILKFVTYRNDLLDDRIRQLRGVSYFINEFIYIFLEEIEKLDEIISITLRQNTHPPGECLFGVIASLGTISGSSPHPTAGKIIYEYLGQFEPDMDLQKTNHWWLHLDECDDMIVRRYLTDVDNLRSGDFILRGRRTF